MKNTKAVSIRLTPEEIATLEKEAARSCVSLNQYMREKLLNSNENKEERINAAQFLDKNLPLITRLIIDGYFHIRQLALQQIGKKELNEINKDSVEVFKKLGIEKKETDQNEDK